MEEVAVLLQSAPQIIKRILRAMSARELHRVSRVCRTWQKYAVLVLKERRHVLTMTATGLNQDNSHAAIVDNSETKQFLQDLDLDCGLAVMFQGIPHPPDTWSSSFATHTSSAHMDYKAMRSYFTPSSSLIGAVCSEGIIGTSSDGSYHEQKEPAVDCLSAFLMPKSLPEGAQMSHFSVSLNQAKELAKSELDRATLAQEFQWPEDEAVKCIIMVAAEIVLSQMPINVDRKLFGAIRVLYDGQVALAGGVADQVFSSAYSTVEKDPRSADEYVDDNYDDDEADFSIVKPAFVGLLFGGENVRAASLVIGQDDQTKESVRERLAELKEKVEAWGECRQKFGFMFASCGRDRPIVDVDESEAEIFKELMPDIPLTGFFSSAEFGWDFPLPLAQQGENVKLSVNTLLYGTTTFAVVGFV
uniref:F-box domain-containing protein n=1 Tax=Plectus sambesii TaxID=2011161 RepID=A0A914WIZ5_9BILA